MNDQSFAILEYGPLLALVRRYTQTARGAMRIEELRPLDDPNDLQQALAKLTETVGLRQRGVEFSFNAVEDPNPTLARLRIEGTALDPLSILQLTRICEQALAARSGIQAERDASPLLWRLVSSLPGELNSVVARIKNKILPNGELDDRASPELSRIRQDISHLRSQITRSLESL